MVNNGALPWLALGILQKDIRAGLILIVLVSVHQILGGHPLALISNCLFLSILAVGVSLQRKSWAPLIQWVAGNLLAILVTLPLLLPVLHGFADTQRSMGMTADEMEGGRFDPGMLGVALMMGMSMWMLYPGFEAQEGIYRVALCSSAAAWLLFPALISQAKWSGLQKATLVTFLLCVLAVIRPRWVTEIMLHLPVLRAMRWPFRELVQLLFFLHLFLLLRPSFFRAVPLRLVAAMSTIVVVVPMMLFPFPPSFNDMPLSRKLVLSGEMEQYWTKVRPLLKPTDRVAVLMSYDVYTGHPERPAGLLGSFNYAMLARITNASGYSHTAPISQLYTKTIPRFPDGSYDIEQKEALLAERPDLKFITLESLRPVRITLSSKEGPTIDLTPYVPTRFRDAK